MKKRSHLALLESRFPDLAVRKDRGGRSFRSVTGREVFRVDSTGSTLTLPVPRNLIEDLFGGLPFPVEARDSGSVVRLDAVAESDLLFDLIDALHEQGLEGPAPEAPLASLRTALPAPEKKAAPPARSGVLARALVVGIAVLVTVFLLLSWSLAQKAVDEDRQRSIQTLLRR